MAINLSDGIRVGQQKPVESKYMNELIPYTDLNQAKTLIPVTQRYPGLTINITGVEYWWKPDETDLNNDPVIKPINSSLADTLLSGGVVDSSEIDSGTLKISPSTWSLTISGTQSIYSTTEITEFNDIALSSEGTQRYIGFYGNSSNNIIIVEGDESSAAVPTIRPVDTTFINMILVTSEGVEIPDFNPEDYVKKSELIGRPNSLVRYLPDNNFGSSNIYDDGTRVAIGNKVHENLDKIERALNILGTDAVGRIGRFTDTPSTQAPAFELISYSLDGSTRRFFWDYFINGDNEFCIRDRQSGEVVKLRVGEDVSTFNTRVAGEEAVESNEFITKNYADEQLDLKANDTDVVHKTGNETIENTKTFNSTPILNFATASRIMATNGSKGIETVIESIAPVITDSATITLLTTAGNWNSATDVYTGTTPTVPFQLQYYKDANYLYYMYTDSVPIRIPISPTARAASNSEANGASISNKYLTPANWSAMKGAGQIVGAWDFNGIGLGAAASSSNAWITFGANTSTRPLMQLTQSTVDYIGSTNGMFWNNAGELKFIDNGIVNRLLKTYNNELFKSNGNYFLLANQYGDISATVKAGEMWIYHPTAIAEIEDSGDWVEAQKTITTGLIFKGQRYYSRDTSYMYECIANDVVIREPIRDNRACMKTVTIEEDDSEYQDDTLIGASIVHFIILDSVMMQNDGVSYTFNGTTGTIGIAVSENSILTFSYT